MAFQRRPPAGGSGKKSSELQDQQDEMEEEDQQPRQQQQQQQQQQQEELLAMEVEEQNGEEKKQEKHDSDHLYEGAHDDSTAGGALGTDDVCEAGGVEEIIAAKWVAEETIWVGSQELRRRGRIREYIQSPHVSVGWKGCRLR